MSDSTRGLAVLVTTEGIVERVVHADPGLVASRVAGLDVRELAFEGDRGKIQSFLEQLRVRSCLLDWEVTLESTNGPRVAKLAGFRIDDRMLIVASEPDATIEAVLEQYASVNSELFNQVRELTKAQAGAESTNSRTVLYEDLSRLNNELANLHREIAYKNHELEQARATLEEQVELRTSELAHTAENLAQALTAKDAFIAQMSHELRTPLNSIIGFSGVMLQGITGKLNEEQERQLGMIQKAGERLLAIVNDILDISRLETEDVELRVEPVELREVVATSMRAIETRADQKGLETSTKIAEDVPSLHTDGELLARIITNLLANAVEYTHEGVVALAATMAGGCLEVRVEDTGTGVAERDRDEIFDPFRQGTFADMAPSHSTGLGLPVSRRLAEVLGGTVELESTQEGVGSVFLLRIPVDHARPSSCA